jgi:hypothetical protein
MLTALAVIGGVFALLCLLAGGFYLWIISMQHWN